MKDAWKCRGCLRTFKGGGVHRTAATETEPVYRYCDHCWAKRADAPIAISDNSDGQ